ncbi:GGDEF domain-containing protein [Paenibacillus piri]|uniref:GGDEF domain-containing protein n=1 Tax=Paenibacillus piri TaxID=2547395 RepID=A0A4R5KUL4_9BACL|nr:GGDEF domain-containing protein [Paenibacillus piri]TDF98627.1 GGDEF domain-containing protein [Paenibacillus piri]
MYHIPFANACTLIALSYIALKLKNRLFMERYEALGAPLLTGLACILMMLQPIPDHTLTTDLSFAPIVMAGLRFGWQISLLSAIIPSLYVYSIEEPFGWMRIAYDFVIPAIISSMFHRKETDSGFAVIPYIDGIKICSILAIVRVAISGAMQRDVSFYFFSAHVMILFLSVAAVIVLIIMYNDENRNWMLQRRLELQANQDGLTGLPNLRSFMNTAGNTIQLRPVSIMMIDIDNFKKYNDTFGHLQGDRLLCEVGQILRGAIYEHDYVARYGGEEFIVLSQVTDYDELSHYGQKLCRAVEAHQSASRETESTTVSIGISVSAASQDELLRLISEADEALYASKNNGKNRFTFFNDIYMGTG